MEDQIREAAALHIRSLHSVLYGRQWNVHEDSDLEAASVWLAGEVRAVLGRVIIDNDRPSSPKVRDYARRLRKPWVEEAADEPGDEVHWTWSSARTLRTSGTWDADPLLDRDWSDAWDTLPEAPDPVPRGKTAQMTMRLPATMLARVKRVAKARAIPYHTLVRSWIVEGLRSSTVPEVEEPDIEAQTAQLNIKLDHAILDALKARGHELRKPYHRLARELVEWETEQAEQALGLDPTPSHLPALKELMVLHVVICTHTAYLGYVGRVQPRSSPVSQESCIEAADEPGDEVHWTWSSARTLRTSGTWDASKGYECPGPHTACGCSNAHWDEEEILEPGFGVPE